MCSATIPLMCTFQHDLIEWLHLLGLGMYHETLAGQGYDEIEYVTDITWEDLEEIGIKKLGTSNYLPAVNSLMTMVLKV